MEVPDYWVVVKLNGIYKVLAGWSGGYLDGENWRLNSGILSVTDTPDHYTFHGYSGNEYKCRKSSYRTGLATLGVLKTLEDLGGELMPPDTDWLTLSEGAK